MISFVLVYLTIWAHLLSIFQKNIIIAHQLMACFSPVEYNLVYFILFLEFNGVMREGWKKYANSVIVFVCLGC